MSTAQAKSWWGLFAADGKDDIDMHLQYIMIYEQLCNVAPCPKWIRMTLMYMDTSLRTCQEVSVI